MAFLVLLQRYVVDVLPLLHLGEALTLQTDDLVVAVTHQLLRLDVWRHWPVLLGDRVLVDVRVALDYAVLQLGVVDRGLVHVDRQRVVLVEALPVLLAVDQDLGGALDVAAGDGEAVLHLRTTGCNGQNLRVGNRQHFLITQIFIRIIYFLGQRGYQVLH